MKEDIDEKIKQAILELEEAVEAIEGYLEEPQHIIEKDLDHWQRIMWDARMLLFNLYNRRNYEKQ